jgi:hypothetical protein
MSDTAAEYLPNPQDVSSATHNVESPNAEASLRPGEFDPLAGDGDATANLQRTGELEAVAAGVKVKPSASAHVLRLFSLSEILSYVPPVGSMLVGEGVIELGEISMLFGPPGSYKGFAVGQLMAYGAQGHGQWLGHPVKAQFASLWLNCENGRRRLRDQFLKMGLPPEAEKFIHVTDIPAVWNLADARLAGEIRRVIVEKEIRLLIIDTVSNFTEDEFAKEYAAFFAALNTLLHGLEPKPAVLLIHHSRKPKDTDKGGRGMLNTISGHQTLQRRARSICYLGRVSDDFDEKRVAAVWLKVSNDGEAEGTKTALNLGEDATLQMITDFDWSQWNGGSSGGAKPEPKVKEEHIRALFNNGGIQLKKARAAERLEEIAHAGRSAVYEALKLEGGRFSHLLVEDSDTGLIGLKPAGSKLLSEGE